MVLLWTWKHETVKSELEVKGGWGEGMVHGKAQLMVEVNIINIRITTKCYMLVKCICGHSPAGSWPGITKEKDIYTLVMNGVYTTTIQNNINIHTSQTGFVLLKHPFPSKLAVALQWYQWRCMRYRTEDKVRTKETSIP